MRRVFADASFYVALISPRDKQHSDAVHFANNYNDVILTTEYVLVELGSLLSRLRFRPSFSKLAAELLNTRGVEIVPASDGLLRDGLQLFADRPDKEWSLTDCISFNVMSSYGITDALTLDHHFSQAGFQLILKDS